MKSYKQQIDEYIKEKQSQFWQNTFSSCNHRYLDFKFFLDLIIIIIISPLIIIVMLSIAVLILFIDGRPILFLQMRIGKLGKIFTIYKFRTMIVNCSNEETVKNDKRITSLGRMLRKYRLD